MGVKRERERLLLDTSFVSVWSGPVATPRTRTVMAGGLAARVDAAGLAVSVVTVAELRAGRVRARWGERRQKQADWRLQRCAQFGIDRRVAEHWAVLKASGAQRGLTFGDNDLWIAATSRALGVTVVTLDGDFVPMRQFGVRVIFAASGVSPTTR